MTSRTNHVIAYALAGLILLSVIPLGGNRPWIWSLLALGTLVLFCFQFARDLVEPGQAARIFRKATYPAIFFLLALLWAALQTLGILPDAVRTEGLIANKAVSVDPERSRLFLSRLLCYGMIFWIAARIGKNTDIGWFLIRVFAIFSTMIALYGLLSYVSGADKILWMDKEWGIGKVTATFVNQNSYAIYCSMGVICNILLLQRNGGNVFTGKFDKKSIRNTLRFMSGENTLFLAGVVTGFVALVFTNSRAGIASGLLGVMTIILIGNTNRTRLIIYTLLAGIPILFLGESLLIRLLNIGGTDHLRLDLYKQTLMLLGDHAVTGQGLGTYKHAFMPYRSAELSWLNWNRAHNSYLEILADLGIIGAGFLFTSLGLILKQCWTGFFKRKHQRDFSALVLALSVTVGIHSMFDFSLQMPAITAVFAMILGIGWVHAFPRQRSKP